jgi:hypothetical protein
MIAEMVFEYFGEEGVSPAHVHLYQPQPSGKQEWRCEFSISWSGFDQRSCACGVDSWGALINATKAVPSYVFATADFKARRIGPHGEPIRSLFKLNELLAIQPFKSAIA